MITLAGKDVVQAIKTDLLSRVEPLIAAGVTPTLAIVRVGERDDDLSYERGATKRMQSVGVAVKTFAFPDTVDTETLVDCLTTINEDDAIHGCLLFRPLPKGLDDDRIRNTLAVEKDIDGITDESMAAAYSLSGRGYFPCTAAACVKILDHYGYDLKGQRVTIVGRSLVVGKPLAMLCLSRHATVTICHTRTRDLNARVREADVVFAAAGQREMLDKAAFREGQIVIDVGIHVTDDGRLTGDVKADDASSLVAALTPVPGGVGTVTTSLLAEHVVDAAEKRHKRATEF